MLSRQAARGKGDPVAKVEEIIKDSEEQIGLLAGGRLRWLTGSDEDGERKDFSSQ